MSLLELLVALEEHGVIGLWRHDGDLFYLDQAPRGRLPRKLKRALKQHKPALLRQLRTLTQDGYCPKTSEDALPF